LSARGLFPISNNHSTGNEKISRALFQVGVDALGHGPAEAGISFFGVFLLVGVGVGMLIHVQAQIVAHEFGQLRVRTMAKLDRFMIILCKLFAPAHPPPAPLIKHYSCGGEWRHSPSARMHQHSSQACPADVGIPTRSSLPCQGCMAKCHRNHSDTVVVP
jgi:hypothetical protein